MFPIYSRRMLSEEVVQNVEVIQISLHFQTHFTFYIECDPSRCAGFCIGPTCVCPLDRTGILCEQVA